MQPVSHSGSERLVVVCGPTATGKTGLAIDLARALGGEIVGADSRQVYRHMDVGTAKPTPAQRARAPHHLIDVVDPDEPFTLADYLDRARAAVVDIQARGRVPLVVGGTGLYVRALVRGFDVPRVPPNPALRRELEQLAGAEGAGALLERLRRADPAAAATVDKDNPRRLIRAIEVAEDTLGAQAFADAARLPIVSPLLGARASSPPTVASMPTDVGAPTTGAGETLALPGTGKMPALPGYSQGYDALIIGLTADRAVLHERADRRVDAMMAEGFLDEVRGLYTRGYAPDLPALSSLGYRELGEHLRGRVSCDDATQATKWATHRFIRRQLTWFRREPDIRWFDITEESVADEAMRLVERWLSAPTARAVRSA